jgi:hypothetical protein
VNRMQLALRDWQGRPLNVELSLRLDTVEAWTDGRCLAVFDRERLRGWLAAPGDVFVEDGMALRVVDQGVVVAVAGRVRWAPVDRQALTDLRDRV